jgi:diaminohydroxyphosphoribosylaminopyrimidine deaminase / 5-amino-6-(5-phosphoribosylamino)uracil reductase
MTETANDERFMRRALALATRGPATGVNPQVGCVLVNEAGEVVAEGWHRGAGTAHAEVDALSKVADATGLTAIVTLEPCNHTGHTGPCSEALIAAGVSRVVYSVPDPSPIAGGGAERLREAGVDVKAGVEAEATEQLLHQWLTAARNQRPYVIVKWASSLDGRAAASDGTSQWITGAAARQHVHERRAAADAILVGTGTVLADDPSLTARGEAGELMEHQPVPVVIGERAIPANAQLHNHPQQLIEVHTRNLAVVLDELWQRDIRRVFVEGGPTVASAFIEADLADEVLVYLAPTLIGGSKTAIGDIGVTTIADQKKLVIVELEQLGDDLVITARRAT